MDYLQNVKLVIQNTVSDCLKITYSYSDKVVTVKRNCNLLKGDFEIRAPKLQKTWSPEFAVSVTKALVEDDQKYVKKVHTNGDVLLVNLNRKKLFEEILNRVLKEGTKYGTTQVASNQYTVLCYLNLNTPDSLDVDQLRSVLLSDHISALLSANGARVTTIYRKGFGNHTEEEVSVQDTLRLVGVCTAGINDRENELSDTTTQFNALAECKWRHIDSEMSTQNNREVNLACDPKACNNQEITLNLGKYISEQTVMLKYDKNINLMKISENSVELKHAAHISDIFQRNKDTKLIHVITHRKEVKCQQIDILSRIITGESMIHAHLRHRGAEVASTEGIKYPTALDFFRSREEQTTRAFSLKYGQSIQDSKWKDIIEQVTRAALKFDFLTTNFSSPVKLTTHVEVEDRGKSGGVFVMYNCARLSMLLSQFHKQVEEGLYSPLPPIEDIDFSTLREEEEWTLLFSYICVYPLVVSGTIDTMESSTIRPQIHTHKICQFLLDLVRDFSSYYSRIHVLVEPRPQLMPTMYARLTLLTAVQHVIHNALALLNIPPLAYM